MSSQSPQFCPDCFKGTLRGDVHPAGVEETIGGLPTYVARPDNGQEPRGIVVIVPDALGWELRNTRALADSYARRIPAVVLLPEFMNGYSLPTTILSSDDRLNAEKSWLYKTFVLAPLVYAQMIRYVVPLAIALRDSVVVPRINGYISSLRSDRPALLTSFPSLSGEGLKIGVVGFCWGGKYAVRLCHTPSPLVDCGFTAHPSLLTIPDDLEKCAAPLSFANGDKDMMMSAAQVVRAKEVLEAKGGLHDVVVYPGAIHGFAVRGDPNDPKQADMGLRAEDQAVNWFRKHFS